MTFAPPTIVAAMRVMTTHGYANGGIVGDTAHAATGVSYHLGKSQLSATAYSIKFARDKAGLSEAASAMDISRGARTAAQLHTWSRWLVAQCQAGAPGTRDIREVIYTPDGKVVKRWDNYAKALYTGGDGTGQGDNSHLWHTHISFPRDSEFRDKTALFNSYFPAAPTGGDVPTPSAYIPGHDAVIKKTANVRTGPKLTATIIRVVASPETWDVTCWVKGDVDPDGGSDQWITRWNAGKWEYTAKSNVTSLTPPAGVPVPPAPDTTPYSQADLDAAKATGFSTGRAAGTVEGTDAEQARVRGVLGL